jgi:hypothetical protein
MSQAITDQQLDTYAELAITAEHDNVKVAPAIVGALVDEVRRLRFQNRFLLRQLAKKDARSGDGDRRLREFLAGGSDTATP